ncbi:ABC transporter ATP-binding protein [Pseudooceanicola sp. CBS1P-1]|uniref:ATP-binding cassette domain-containing protein n=1 Tax=Pseudooceanicola albus TaxID=2692189 RepID=A0A6L7GA96_9RHOB|nr:MULTISPECIES: ABC transporter ATP-binding protein [Pseudooceanicola]MBT9386773.1 ABC transporter ATP-binding protein [Pseudooceanicola endophyticus]MXN20965.1 ATP-binding cassette domain-containing protein [Pseudooceanicola albus]
MDVIQIERLEAFYGDMQALFGVSLGLRAGETFALVGANGAGKSTLMRALVGLVRDRRGHIRLGGEELIATSPEQIARAGIALVPEGRQLFASLTVEENLQMGAMNRRRGPWDLEAIYGLFPVLRERRRQMAVTMSGGQQQMVAIGRALMANPRVLLCDELSLGLAPVIVSQIYDSFARIRAEGMSMIIVEQDIERAIAVSDRMACLLHGQVTLRVEDTARVDIDALSAAYFGE